jgi:hypothetical protein
MKFIEGAGNFYIYSQRLNDGLQLVNWSDASDGCVRLTSRESPRRKQIP